VKQKGEGQRTWCLLSLKYALCEDFVPGRTYQGLPKIRDHPNWDNPGVMQSWFETLRGCNSETQDFLKRGGKSLARK
jgi:hypothetical protein